MRRRIAFATLFILLLCCCGTLFYITLLRTEDSPRVQKLNAVAIRSLPQNQTKCETPVQELQAELSQVNQELQAELSQVKQELQAELSQVNQELKAELSQANQELKAELSQVNQELQAELNQELKAELSQANRELKAELSQANRELKAELSQANRELKAELSQANRELKAELSQVNRELKAELSQANREPKAELSQVNQELQAELNQELKAELSQANQELQAELNQELKAELSQANQEPKEGTLLENNDPNFEPVTPACSINPPTAPEGETEVPPFPIGFSPLSESAVKGVEKFVYFIGYGRSGHSTIASMLDAHPNIIIAHEYSIFEQLKTMGPSRFRKEFIFNELYRNSYKSALCRDGWRNIAMNKKNYTLDVPGLWQGRFTELKVVGDKAAGYTSIEYQNSPESFAKLHSEFLKTIGIPVQVIHVVRNPYDIIATSQLYLDSGPNYGLKLRASSNHRFFHSESLTIALNRTFNKAEAVVNMKQALNLNVIDIYMEDFVVNPVATLQKLCSALGVECSERYLKKCKDKAFKKLPKTRNFVWWPKPQFDSVKKMCQDFPFFRRYDFYNNNKE